jgi:hypothetical protein
VTHPAPIDSIAAAATLARSSRLRTLLSWLGALLLPVAGSFVGYVAKSVETRSGYELLRADVAATRADLAALRVEVAAAAGVERKVLRIGKQAAYATAGFQAYEPDKLRRQKQSWAKSYAESYERLVTRDGLTPDAAFAVLFEQVAVP